MAGGLDIHHHCTASFLPRVFSTRHFPKFLFGLFRCESLLHIGTQHPLHLVSLARHNVTQRAFIYYINIYNYLLINTPPLQISPLSARWTVQYLTGINGQPSSRNMLDELIGVTQHIYCPARLSP